MSSGPLVLLQRAVVTNGALHESYARTGEAESAQLMVHMRGIENLLAAAAMSVLDQGEAIKHWTDMNDALASISAQPEQKLKGGRPRGGVSEAARRLPLPKYMSNSAKRQYVQRHIRIATRIFPRAKDEARFQQLDDNQTALLAIAAEETEEAQLAVARAWRFRNVRPADAPKQQESYRVTGLENLPDDHRKRIDRLMRLAASRYRLFVVHANAPDDFDGDQPN